MTELQGCWSNLKGATLALDTAMSEFTDSIADFIITDGDVILQEDMEQKMAKVHVEVGKLYDLVFAEESENE
jgi:hypothetical protein